ncbi:MAG: hypothetical protein IPJ40_07625 [Saprospirales bacterium]|nr:hypothetical protein [Saprospirales bacterium]
MIRMLSDAKIDLLEVSGGTYENIVFLVNEEAPKKKSTRQREAYFLDFAQEVRQISSIPLMVTGGFRTPSFAEEALQNGELDIVGMARPFCTHPERIPAFLAGEDIELPSKAIRTGIPSMDDSAEGGYYAWQIIRLARGKGVKLNFRGCARRCF